MLLTANGEACASAQKSWLGRHWAHSLWSWRPVGVLCSTLSRQQIGKRYADQILSTLTSRPLKR
jgi:hypothetical protein